MSTTPVATQEVPEKLVHVFKGKMPSFKYIFLNGKEASFINHEFTTDIQSEIDELNAEIASRHPHIYVQEGEETKSSTMVDPLETVRTKAVADYIAAQEVANNKTNDRGTTSLEKLKVATSASVVEGSADSTSAALK
jgi:hypothetical protein